MITLRVTVGYDDAPCDFEMRDGEALWNHLATLIKHSPKEKDNLKIRIERIIADDEPEEENNDNL